MQQKTKMDPFHGQIIAGFLQTKSDFINFICIKKEYEYILDRFRINPIPITEETKNLFQFLDTQQIFQENSDEVILQNVKIQQYNYQITYSKMKEIEENTPHEKDLKFKKVTYEVEDRRKYGNEIPKEVTNLGIQCFSGCEEKEIQIHSNVKEIESYCFSECRNLQKIVIPDSVTKISSNAFDDCSQLSSIILSTNILKLNWSTFSNCKELKHLQLPPYLLEINTACFENCAIEEIEIPRTLTLFSRSSFEHCLSLTKVCFSDNCEVKDIPSSCFNECSSLSEITFSSSIEFLSYDSFSGCSSLKSVIIPSSVTLISKNVFKDCKELKELIIENNQCKIQGNFIEGCTSLTKIQMPTIKGYCNYIPSLSEKEILERNGIKTYQSISEPIIRNELKSVELENIELLKQQLLETPKITSLYIPSTVTELDYMFFNDFKKLEDVILPPNIIINKEYAVFSENSNFYEFIKFMNGKTCIDEETVYFASELFKKNGIQCQNIVINYDVVFEYPKHCNLKIENCTSNIHLLDEIQTNITEINDFKFLKKSLTSLTIPSTVKKCLINNSNCNYFQNLVELKCYKHQVNDNHLIDDLTTLTNIEVVDGSLDDILVSYEYHLQMKEKGIILNNVDYTKDDRIKYGNELPEIVKSIQIFNEENYSLKKLVKKKIVIRKYDYNTKEFIIPSYQTKMYNGMFLCCSYLKNIQIPNEIKDIEEETFTGCLSLESIKYEKELDGNCIKGCESLQSIPKIKSLEPANFNNCSYLSSIRLNDSIEKIPGCCFNKCLSLFEIIIPSKCTEIDVFAFKFCMSLKTVIIPKSVKKINDGAFYRCDDLEQIIIENEEIEIGYDSFGECTSLKEIIIGNKKIEEYKFEVNYSQMKQFEKIGIKCNNIVIRREDIKQYGIEILNDSRVRRIHDNCFRDNEELVELTIPTHITKLGLFSFSNCKKLKRVIIPTSIKEIPYCCFEHCEELEEVSLPSTIEFERKSFWQCQKLNEETRKFISFDFIGEVKIEEENDDDEFEFLY